MLELANNIVSEPDILGGKLIIKGTRISVVFILQLLASGMSIDDILAGYPHLTKDGVLSAIEYAANSLANERVLAIK